MTASSEKTNCLAASGRLNDVTSCGAWCAAAGSGNSHWLQVDFPTAMHVSGLSVQGAPNGNRMTSFMLSSSHDGQDWLEYGCKASESNVSRTVVGYNKMIFYSPVTRLPMLEYSQRL